MNNTEKELLNTIKKIYVLQYNDYKERLDPALKNPDIGHVELEQLSHKIEYFKGGFMACLDINRVLRLNDTFGDSLASKEYLNALYGTSVLKMNKKV